MKKALILIPVYLICISNQSLGQTEAGNHTLGGTAGISRQTNGTQFTSTAFNLNPMYGYFTYDRLLLGADLNLSLRGGGRRVGGGGIKAGPFLRYYFQNHFFVQGDDNFGFANRASFENDVYARVGYAWFLNKHVAIEPYAYFGYQYFSTLPARRRFNPVYNATSPTGNYDYGIYFNIQVYLESNLNKRFRDKKGILKPKEKGLQ